VRPLSAENRDAAVAEVTPARHHANLRAVDLALAGFSAQLADGLDDVVHAEHVRLGQQTTVSVDRQLPAQLDAPAGDEGAFPNAGSAIALIDRIIHHADVISIEGDSFRRREAEQTQATRRAKRKG
jgi:hypothetical protein